MGVCGGDGPVLSSLQGHTGAVRLNGLTSFSLSIKFSICLAFPGCHGLLSADYDVGSNLK